ncbi:hypothetical protein [Mesorhizobium retamae]|uniref:Uncharacterized protein n=1 Tax=Mesorhizobium retamae TaxID=2912854 RepID=A0ABS9QID5_9HYPH|nr:hypothetical protein [Mesorhizobium sp. IRAMC:0171]MCG7507219.1 hypothetical protein [Mesorhizobium sp. IRAMC:0171]
MPEPILHEIHSVKATEFPDVFILRIDRTDAFGERAASDYVSVPNDTVGLGPIVRVHCEQWLADGKPIVPYAPPTLEQVREAMPALTPRQLRLGLINGGHSVVAVQAAIDGIVDPVTRERAQVEWGFASNHARLHPLIGQIAAALSITETQIDDMWTAAVAL